jgi:hypothetical protein
MISNDNGYNACIEVSDFSQPPTKKTAGQIEKETDEALHKQLITK